MKKSISKIRFEGEECIVPLGGEEYRFMILGSGVLPIGEAKNIHVTIELRPFIKEHFQKEIRAIQKWQTQKEILQFLNHSK